MSVEKEQPSSDNKTEEKADVVIPNNKSNQCVSIQNFFTKNPMFSNIDDELSASSDDEVGAQDDSNKYNSRSTYIKNLLGRDDDDYMDSVYDDDYVPNDGDSKDDTMSDYDE